jgi:hypothetical protein
MRIVISRNCWDDPETGIVLEEWFQLFLQKIRTAYPNAEIEIQPSGRCIKVYAADSDEEWSVERHLNQISEEALFEWANDSNE